MNITKDEARILAAALNDQQYEYYHLAETKEIANDRAHAIHDLIKRLDIYSHDERRTGRRSSNQWSDMMKRFVIKYKEKSK